MQVDFTGLAIISESESWGVVDVSIQDTIQDNVDAVDFPRMLAVGYRHLGPGINVMYSALKYI